MNGLKKVKKEGEVEEVFINVWFVILGGMFWFWD